MKNTTARIIVPFLFFTVTTPVDVRLAQEGATLSPGTLALRYAETSASGRIDDWVRLDLGCLSRLRGAPTVPSEARSPIAHISHEDTVSISCRIARCPAPQPIDHAV